MFILSVDTSADETSASVTNGRRVLSNVIYSQINLHKKWGGIVPDIAKRAHQQRIDGVINLALRRAKVTFKDIDFLAITYGPGLAIALEVGINKIKELSVKYDKKVIPVNHLEGHLYSCWAQNRNGNPLRPITLPVLGLIISGGHTEMVIINNHRDYQIIGETVDDAIGESLDKAARMLTGAGYPGGPIIERLAKDGNPKSHRFPRPLQRPDDLNFSYSGLKTSLFYYLKKLPEKDKIKNLNNIAASYQQAAFDSLIYKLQIAFRDTKLKTLLVGGGVIANLEIKRRIKKLAKENNVTVYYPSSKLLIGDNAAMIGIVAYFSAIKNHYLKDINQLERQPRSNLDDLKIIFGG